MQNGYGQDFGPKQMGVGDGSGAVAGAMLNAPKSVPPMDVSMRNLGMNIERLAQAVQVLHGKLDPVLYPEPPSPNVNQAVETRGPRASSNLGNAVNGFADQIEAITDRVNSIIRRCEL